MVRILRPYKIRIPLLCHFRRETLSWDRDGGPLPASPVARFPTTVRPVSVPLAPPPVFLSTVRPASGASAPPSGTLPTLHSACTVFYLISRPYKTDLFRPCQRTHPLMLKRYSSRGPEPSRLCHTHFRFTLGFLSNLAGLS